MTPAESSQEHKFCALTSDDDAQIALDEGGIAVICRHLSELVQKGEIN